ncbi:MAG: hypothetical protein CMJ40_04330 [Phycisphaerae bacterium]|nr:hypothetical protein [Phycisphaerae bacterium]|tara:strand:- start:1529 stop:2512 length:984 start_codon:yes stop_codon:yes gene_type:complete
MFRKWKLAVEKRINHVVKMTTEGVRRRDRFLRVLIDASRIAVRQMRRDRAPMMASALTYRLLFSLIPLMIIAASVMSLFITEDEVKRATSELIAHLQLDSIEVHDLRVDKQGDDGNSPFTLGDWISDTASQAAGYNTSGMTILGILLLVYSALKLFGEIEATFSIVSGRGRRRSWWRRWGMYLIVLLLGPLFLAGGLWLIQWGSNQLTEIGGGHVVIVSVAERVLSWALIWGLVIVGYLFIPAQRLGLRATASGALVATVMLLLAQWGFGIYVRKAVVGSPVGSLGLMPLFLFWLYLNWVSLLYGLQFAAVAARVSKLVNRRRTAVA